MCREDESDAKAKLRRQEQNRTEPIKAKQNVCGVHVHVFVRVCTALQREGAEDEGAAVVVE